MSDWFDRLETLDNNHAVRLGVSAATAPIWLTLWFFLGVFWCIGMVALVPCWCWARLVRKRPERGRAA